MAYIGNDLRSNEDYKIIDDISSGFNGSATSFALQVGGATPVPFPKFEQQLLISVNGVIQEPDPTGSAGFKLLGTNIVFSSAPTNGHAFFGVIYAGADYVNAGGTFPDGSINFPSITFSADTNTGFTRTGSGTVALISDGNKIAQFPTSQGSSGQALITDGSGNLSFSSTISSPIVTGDLTIPDSIIHNGDSDTKIRFPGTDIFSVETGGVERLSLGTTTVFNETGADVDFRIEGDTESNLFYVNAGNESIGIGSSSANSGRLHVTHSTGTIGYFESTQASSNVANIVGNSTQTNSSSNLILQVNSGTTAQGIIRLNGDNSIGIHNGATPTEKLRIDSSGNVGIGKTSPSDRLDVQTTHSSGGRIATFYNSDSGNNGGLIIQGGGSDGEARLQSAGGTSFLTFYTEGTGNLAERMRILSNGRIGFATSSTTGLGSQTGNANVCTFNFAGVTITQYSVTAGFYYDRLNFTNSQYFIVNSSGTGVYLGSGSTSFTAHSDERLKTNITELDGTKAYNHVKTARAASFKWNATGYPTDTKIGFIAQDWETDYPEVTNSTTETIDSVENPKGIQYTETIPVLMAALKQAITKIETLETKVAALEAA